MHSVQNVTLSAQNVTLSAQNVTLRKIGKKTTKFSKKICPDPVSGPVNRIGSPDPVRSGPVSKIPIRSAPTCNIPSYILSYIPSNSVSYIAD